MLNGPKFLQIHSTAIAQLCLNRGIERLYAFGSVVGDGFTDQSDVDFLVKFNNDQSGDDYFTLLDELKKLLNKDVDLLTTGQLTNPYFIAQLNNTKVLIYGK
jgi:predicted nucleotidyltransferase